MENEAENPYGEITKREGNAIADASTAREVQEVQAMMTIAKRFPRDEKEAMGKIIKACTRQGLAESALYVYAKGGTEVSGPSIRLAEAIAQSWGNIQFGIRELEQRNGESTVEAMAWDMETNTRQCKVFQVKHERYTRAGNKKLSDPRDIYEMVANQGARRLRACILGIIPGDVVDAAVKQCDITLAQGKGECTPEKIESMLAAFSAYGVKKEQIEKKIQRNVESMSKTQMVQLGKIYNSIKDGMGKPSDYFDEVEKLTPADL